MRKFYSNSGPSIQKCRVCGVKIAPWVDHYISNHGRGVFCVACKSNYWNEVPAQTLPQA
jgi:hypothetical protein